MDNASNNDTFISALQRSLILRENSEILFSGSTQRIRYVIYLYLCCLTYTFKIVAFHIIVNLACKAMLQNTRGLNVDEFDEDIEEESEDPVKKLRGIIQHVSAWALSKRVYLDCYRFVCPLQGVMNFPTFYKISINHHIS
jgi:hypothetical protein